MAYLPRGALRAYWILACLGHEVEGSILCRGTSDSQLCSFYNQVLVLEATIAGHPSALKG